MLQKSDKSYLCPIGSVNTQSGMEIYGVNVIETHVFCKPLEGLNQNIHDSSVISILEF